MISDLKKNGKKLKGKKSARLGKENYPFICHSPLCYGFEILITLHNRIIKRKRRGQKLKYGRERRNPIDNNNFCFLISVDQEQQIIQLTEKVIKSVTSGDFQTYRYFWLSLLFNSRGSFATCANAHVKNWTKFTDLHHQTDRIQKFTEFSQTRPRASPLENGKGGKRPCIGWSRVPSYTLISWV